jgi:hypothetical protein
MVVEVWKCKISQVEIMRRTREGIKAGLSLAQIKARLPLSIGHYPPDSVQYANDLIIRIGSAPRVYLEKPLCAVFIQLTRWQID